MKKVIIADDEAAGRKLIREYLQHYPDLIIISEVNNGVDAVKQINEFKPDLVFLDIQMPGFNGFEVLTRIDEIPLVIFSTAYDQYALQAFEVHAVDYLLKPYTKDRFQKAVARLEKAGEANSAGLLAESLLMSKSSYPSRILVNHQRKLINITVESIIWVEAQGDYAKLHINGNVFLSNYGISTLEEKLDPSLFIRVHRSAIVNLRQIKELMRSGKSYDVTMNNGDVVRVSLGYLEKLKEIMY